MCKQLLNQSVMLMHFDQQKQIMICTDASDDGLGAVLCPFDKEGIMKPVWFQSRTFSATEKRYPILHRELLAIVFACEKYYKFIFRSKIVIFCDHKPLLSMIKTGLTLPTIHTRVQRYLWRLQPFDITIKYKEGKFNNLADYASRFPLQDQESEEDVDEEKRAQMINLVRWAEH